MGTIFFLTLSLQHSVASTIKRHTPQDDIDKLPLPKTLKTFIKEVFTKEVEISPLKDPEEGKNREGTAGPAVRGL